MCVKISGDGARFSSSSSFLLLSFSFPGSSESVLSGAGWSSRYMCSLASFIIFCPLGNHTFAAIRGIESYSLLSSLKDVLAEINSLIKEPVLYGVPSVSKIITNAILVCLPLIYSSI